MIKRIIFGNLMLLLLAGLIIADWFLTQKSFYYSGPGYFGEMGVIYKAIPLFALGIILIPLAFWEMYKLAGVCGIKMPPISTAVCALLIGTEPYWVNWLYLQSRALARSDVFLILLGLCVMLVFAAQIRLKSPQDAMKHIGGSVLTMLYLGIGMASVIQLRIDMGLASFVMFLLAAKFTDIGAYFTGSAIGKHKMIPWLSPKKSWEGLAGGIILSAGLCGLLSYLCQEFNLQAAWSLDAGLPPVIRAIIFGVLIALAGQFGDLCESLLKRSAQIKDSGAVIPGFGGLLDILDSILLSAPVAFLTLKIFKLFPSIIIWGPGGLPGFEDLKF